MAFLLAFGLATCGGSSDADGTVAGKVNVLAAASLTEAFTELGKVYEKEHEGSEVVFSFAGSSDLGAQIKSGAPADVFASADEPNMKLVADEGLVEGEPVTFVSNVLELAMPKGNPGEVKDLSDLSRKDLKVAVCASEVPCGTATKKLLDEIGVEGSVDTFEPDVKSVLTKVELGEVDVGLVYRSDVVAAGDKIESIIIPEADVATNTYPIARLGEGRNQDGGQAFIDLVLSETGQTEFEKRGFRSP